MAKNEQTPFERALARATKDGIRITMDFGSHWRVVGSDGVTLYRVALVGEDEMTCSCKTKAGVLCKHIAVCIARMQAEQAEANAALAEAMAEVAQREEMAAQASAALVLAERSERTLANVTNSQEQKLVAVCYAPVAALAYTLVAGAAKGQALAAEKEARYQRYRDASWDNFAA